MRPTSSFFNNLAFKFPKLTEQDLLLQNRTGPNKWENRVHFTRFRLIKRGDLTSPAYGVWQITEQGRERVLQELPPVEAEIHAETRHKELQRKVEQIGRVLRRYARSEFAEGPYIYDVIWKDSEHNPLVSHVFEVQDKGSVVEALAKLKHARDRWRAELILVVIDEKDRRRAERLLHPYLSGTFHEIAEWVRILLAEDIDAIHLTLESYKDAFAWFAR